MSESRKIEISGGRTKINSFVQGNVDKIESRMGQSSSPGADESFGRFQAALIQLAYLVESDSHKVEALESELKDIRMLLEEEETKDSGRLLTRVGEIGKRISWAAPILKYFLERYLPSAP